VLKSLSEEYALRAREFSDTVAPLGRHSLVGPEFLKLFEEIKGHRASCRDAEEKLEHYIRQQNNNSQQAGAA